MFSNKFCNYGQENTIHYFSCDLSQEISACPHRQFHTLPRPLDSQTALSISYPTACGPSSEAVCTIFMMVFWVRAATNESQKTLNKCETRNKTVFHTRLRHPETINSVPLNSVLRIKQIGV